MSPSVCLSRQLCLTFAFDPPPFTVCISPCSAPKQGGHIYSLSVYVWNVNETLNVVVLVKNVWSMESCRDVSSWLSIHMLLFIWVFFGLCLEPVGSEGRRRSREEEEEEALKRKLLQEEHLSKVSRVASPSTNTVNIRCNTSVFPKAFHSCVTLMSMRVCRFSPVWGSSFWRRRWKKSR